MGEVEMGCQLTSDLFSLFFCITRYPMLPLLNLRPRLPAPADEFHLGTLQLLLSALPQLQPGVRVLSVLSLLMDRLAK